MVAPPTRLSIANLVGGPNTISVFWTAAGDRSYTIYTHEDGVWASTSAGTPGAGVTSYNISTVVDNGLHTHTFVLVEFSGETLTRISLPATITTGGYYCFGTTGISRQGNTITIHHPEYNLPAGTNLAYLVQRSIEDGGMRSTVGQPPYVPGNPTTVDMTSTENGIVGSYILHITPVFTDGNTMNDYSSTMTTLPITALSTYTPTVSVSVNSLTISWDSIVGYNLTAPILRVYKYTGATPEPFFTYTPSTVEGSLNSGSYTVVEIDPSKQYSATFAQNGDQVLTTTNAPPPVTSEFQTIDKLSCTFTPGDASVAIAYTPPNGTVKDITFFYLSDSGNGSGPLVGGSVAVREGIYVFVVTVSTEEGTLYISDATRLAVGLVINPIDLSLPEGTNNIILNGTSMFTVRQPRTLDRFWAATMTAELDAAITAGFPTYDFNTYAYALNATFAGYTAPGSTNMIRNYSCLVRMAIYNSKLFISPIDRTDTQWTENDSSGPMLMGTFTLPVTFTAYNPITTIEPNNAWC